MNHPVVYAKDYAPLSYNCFKIEMYVDLYEEKALVNTVLHFKKKDFHGDHLFLNGEKFKLLEWNYFDSKGQKFELKELPQFSSHGVTFFPEHGHFSIEFKTETYPQKNKTYTGLYQSEEIFSTQNEAEGFRTITYSFDRPDSLSEFWVSISADKDKYPVLLSNGHLVAQGICDDAKHRHFVRWHDPSLKPTYLMALVAGNLSRLHDEFLTKNGKKVLCEIYAPHDYKNDTKHAMESLKRAMRWDEERFGLEYDLERYMIVAVSSFNGGAMENKGLNIFNTKFVLGNFETSTDDQLYQIESVIGHEYFHNWTGNRITPKDWFQLTLKEGLTVFRDQEFSSDLHSRSIKRIEDIKLIKERQFREDVGPFAHSIRPETYQEINNFYTLTVYEKGAEFFRMLQTVLGKNLFLKAFTHFISEYDGKSASLENFWQSCLEVSKFNKDKSFAFVWNWVSQVGTAKIEVQEFPYVKRNNEYEYRFLLSQTSQILGIPLRLAFFNEDGQKLSIKDDELCMFDHKHSTLSSWEDSKGDEWLLVLQDESIEIILLTHFPSVVMSINRNFSAPVLIKRSNFNLDSLKVLARFDDDPINQWESVQELFEQSLLSPESVQNSNLDWVEGIMNHSKLQSDPAFVAQLLGLPSESVLIQKDHIYEFDLQRKKRQLLKSRLAMQFQKHMIYLLEKLNKKVEDHWDQTNMGMRKLKYVILDYLMAWDASQFSHFCINQVEHGRNMTEKTQSLLLLNKYQVPSVENMNQIFLDQYHHIIHLKELWFHMQTQVLSLDFDLISKVKQLSQHKYFSLLSPNLNYALLGGFMNNFPHLHHSSGSAYAWSIEMIEKIDHNNPMLAAVMAKNFPSLNRLSLNLRGLLRNSLFTLIQKPQTSKDVYEIIEKCLNRKFS